MPFCFFFFFLRFFLGFSEASTALDLVDASSADVTCCDNLPLETTVPVTEGVLDYSSLDFSYFYVVSTILVLSAIIYYTVAINYI